jgi:hypothetical protein
VPRPIGKYLLIALGGGGAWIMHCTRTMCAVNVCSTHSVRRLQSRDRFPSKATAATQQDVFERYRNRTAFTWAPSDCGDIGALPPSQHKMAETAKLVGQGSGSFKDSLDASFFRRRARFRRTMQAEIMKSYDVPHENKGKPLDLPGYWTRPTLMPARRKPNGVLDLPDQEFTVSCNFPQGGAEAVEVYCSATDTMSDLLRRVYAQRPEHSVADSALSDPSCFILKVQGLYDFLDGDDQLIDYRYLRKCLNERSTAHVTVLRRDELVAEMKGKEAELVNDPALEDSVLDDEHEIDSAELQRRFDPTADKSTWEFIPLAELHRPFRFCVLGIDNLPVADWRERKVVDDKEITEEPSLQFKGAEKGLETQEWIYVEAGLYHGGKQLVNLGEPLCKQSTTQQSRSSNPRWYEWLVFDFDMSRLPAATRLCITVMNRQKLKTTYGPVQTTGRSSQVEYRPLGWVNIQLFDDAHRLQTGTKRLRLWPKDTANPIGTCVDNISSAETCVEKTGQRQPAVLYLELDEYHAPVLCPSSHAGGAAQARLGSDTLGRPSAWTHEDKQELARVVSEDPLYVLQDDEKELVFNLRYQCVLPAACVATILAPLSLWHTVLGRSGCRPLGTATQ